MSHKRHARHAQGGRTGAGREQGSRESKRAQFAAPSEGPQAPKASDTTKILVVVIAALVGIVSYLVMSGLDDRPRAASLAAAAPAQAASRPEGGGVNAGAGGEVAIPLSELSGKARFYEYAAASGKTVRFFAMKSSDGVYRAAVDSCDVCFAAKKGYHQEGDDMVCNKCGNRFHSTQVNEVRGGCNPVGLDRAVSGDKLVIKASDLDAGASYF